MNNNSNFNNEFQITYTRLEEYFFKSCKGEDPYKMFLIACDIERDYLPLLNGNMTNGLYLERNITTYRTPMRDSMDKKN